MHPFYVWSLRSALRCNKKRPASDARQDRCVTAPAERDLSIAVGDQNIMLLQANKSCDRLQADWVQIACLSGVLLCQVALPCGSVGYLDAFLLRVHGASQSFQVCNAISQYVPHFRLSSSCCVLSIRQLICDAFSAVLVSHFCYCKAALSRVSSANSFSCHPKWSISS